MAPATDELRLHIAALATAPRFLPFLWSKQYRTAISVFRASSGQKANRKVIHDQFRCLLAVRQEVAAFAAQPSPARLFGYQAVGIDSPFDAALEAARWRESVGQAGQGLGPVGRRLLECSLQGQIGDWREAAGLLEREPAVAEEGGRLTEVLGALARATGNSHRAWDDAELSSMAREFEASATACAGLLEAFTSNGADGAVTVENLRRRVATASDALRAQAAASADLAVCDALGVSVSDEAARNELREALCYLQDLSSVGIPDGARRWLVADAPLRRKGELERAFKVAAESARASSDAAARFGASGGVSWPHWIGGIQALPDEAALADLLRRLVAALEQEPTLHTWARYTRFRFLAAKAGGEPICDLVDEGKIQPEQAADAYEAAAYATIANAMLRGDPELARLAGTDMQQARERFAKLDTKFINLTAEMYSHQLSQVSGEPGRRGAYAADYTEGALVERVAGQAQPRITIREVFKRASKWLMQMKPCFMMSPLAVSHYLPPGAFDFDLIVMDEASQIRPEDALGAIARGRQLLVVGDPMQLGPTNFFARHVDAEEEDDEVEREGPATATPAAPRPRGVSVIEQSESILQAAAARFPMRVLKWHYRSRHPKLIAFSNKEFYGNDLIVFPTPEFGTGTDGVHFRPVPGAVYESHVNVREAEAVVAAVKSHVAEHPDKSLLIATLNLHQADLIERLLERAEMDDPALADYRARFLETAEPLDVKNLENVQGDERDVIFVSITFGPKPDGSFAQAFGPINQVGGERRLNVLFTRAKYRLEVFCSFDPTQLRIDGNAPRGLRVMAEYLKYAQDGRWATGAPTGHEPDSDFEVAVARALLAHGLQVQPQVGVAGYRIDLGIHHPRKPGVYILGVECDGATYHSAKSARDRDRLRESVLKGYGWNIHRIWSTDWFRDPTRQVSAVVDRVRQLEAAV
jgi:very-short-patch-repair endonuclease